MIEEIKRYDGLIVKEQSGFYWVETADGTVYMCRLRGRLTEEAQLSDIAAIGDRVVITPLVAEGSTEDVGVIEEVHERHTILSRAVRTTGKRGSGQSERQQVLIANPDQVFLVFSVTQPTPNFQLLDRLLVCVESESIEQIVIIFNKVDLEDPLKVDQFITPYRKMGYEILLTSAFTEDGLIELRKRLEDKVSVFTGPSGVGKTSLLNKIQPGLGRSVKAISEYSQEGIHTTRDSALIKLEGGGYLADTPGIRHMNIWDVEPDELDAYFIDLAAFSTQCKFRNCSHENEPGCAVLAALESGEVNRRRYENFIQIRAELRETYIVY